MTEAEIKTNYKTQHDNLSGLYYSGNSGLTKEEFDQQHGQVWGNMRVELIEEGFISTVYMYEAFTKEIVHPKKDTSIYVGYELLEFNQELTTTEIAALQLEMGKTIRKLIVAE